MGFGAMDLVGGEVTGLLAETSGQRFRMLCGFMGFDGEGLAVVARRATKKRLIINRMCKRLMRLDTAAAVARHLNRPRAQTFVESLALMLQVDKVDQRIAPDGKPYGWHEFVAHYGEAQALDKWVKAAPVEAMTVDYQGLEAELGDAVHKLVEGEGMAKELYSKSAGQGHVKVLYKQFEGEGREKELDTKAGGEGQEMVINQQFVGEDRCETQAKELYSLVAGAGRAKVLLKQVEGVAEERYMQVKCVGQEKGLYTKVGGEDQAKALYKQFVGEGQAKETYAKFAGKGKAKELYTMSAGVDEGKELYMQVEGEGQAKELYKEAAGLGQAKVLHKQVVGVGGVKELYAKFAVEGQTKGLYKQFVGEGEAKGVGQEKEFYQVKGVGGSSGNGTGLGSRLEKRAPEPLPLRGCGLVQDAAPSLGAPAAFVRTGMVELVAAKSNYLMVGGGQTKEPYMKAAGGGQAKVLYKQSECEGGAKELDTKFAVEGKVEVLCKQSVGDDLAKELYMEAAGECQAYVLYKQFEGKGKVKAKVEGQAKALYKQFVGKGKAKDDGQAKVLYKQCGGEGKADGEGQAKELHTKAAGDLMEDIGQEKELHKKYDKQVEGLFMELYTEAAGVVQSKGLYKQLVGEGKAKVLDMRAGGG